MDYIEESKLLEGDEIFVATYNKDIREADNPMTEIYEEGMEDKQNEIVKNMYEQGLSLDIIAKVIKHQ